MGDPTATTLHDILSQAENTDHARRSTARVLLRQDLVSRHTELDAALQEAVARDALRNEPDRAPALQKEITALESEMKEAEVEFVFRSIGRRKWADLLAKHPPTDKQKRDDRRVVFNPETFPVAAIAASCESPEGMDVAAASRLEVSLSDAQFSVLWNACIDANLGGGDLPKSVLAAGLTLRTSVPSATTAAQEESPEASS